MSTWNVEVLPLVVRDHQELMLAKPEILDRLPRRFFPLRPARPLAWPPAQLIVIDRIGEARILKSYGPHLGRRRFAGKPVVRKKDARRARRSQRPPGRGPQADSG